jgi:hypothetical protein
MTKKGESEKGWLESRPLQEWLLTKQYMVGNATLHYVGKRLAIKKSLGRN